MKGESKSGRFKRVAERRVQRVLDSLRSLSQCANKRMYQWEDNDLKKIWEAVDKELKNCKTSYETAEPQEFKF